MRSPTLWKTRRRSLGAAAIVVAVVAALTGVILVRAGSTVQIPENFPVNPQNPTVPVFAPATACASPTSVLPIQTPTPNTNPVDNTPGLGDTPQQDESYWTQQRMQQAVPNDQQQAGSCAGSAGPPTRLPPVSVPGTTPLVLP